MSTNPNDSVSPSVAGTALYRQHEGLTKREYFASDAMQGLVSQDLHENGDPILGVNVIAEWAVMQADALIEELNKDKE